MKPKEGDILPIYTLEDLFAQRPEPDEPYVADFKIYDIPETLALTIRNARPNVVAITFGSGLDKKQMRTIKRECAKKGIRPLWS